MIIFRYVLKEVIVSCLAVSFVLLLIIVSARFVTYLAEAASGSLESGVLLTLMTLRMPAYLELILPLGLFIGILLAFGRLYVESEMVVLSACGVSEGRMLSYALTAGLILAALVALLSLELGPRGVMSSEALLAEQRSRTDFETLKPARFHELDTGRGISYAESISEDKQQLHNVFMAEVGVQGDESPPVILMADSGETLVDKEKGEKFLLLRNGRRYVGRPGDGNFEIIQFQQYAQKLPEPDYAASEAKESDGLPTLELFKRNTPQALAALQWRLSLPLLVIVICFLAVPLSRTKPRRGRYGSMVPAVVIYVVYLVLVNAAKTAVENGSAPVIGLVWLVHLGFFLLAALLYFGSRLLHPAKLLREVFNGANA